MKTSLTPVVLCGDARHVPLADGSVHCVVTSPPYWGLRSYSGDAGMIGLEETFDEHLSNLVQVFREVRRVLRDDGTLFLNYGDKYNAGTNSSRPKPIKEVDVGYWTNPHTGMRVNADFCKTKDLMMMPARVAMALQADGVADGKVAKVLARVIAEIEDAYDEEEIPDKVQVVLERLWAEYTEVCGDAWWIRSEIIWWKPNPMPESVTDRPTSSHEKVFLLTKKPRYFYDADAVREPATGRTGSTSYGHAPDRRDNNRTYFPDGLKGANLRNVWRIPTHSFPGAHFATFPPALAKRCILAGTSAAGVCAGCGAPWVRQTERKLVGGQDPLNADNYKDDDKNNQGSNRMLDGHRRSAHISSTTTGWLPSCTCDAGRVPATVFDPFGGSGTVGIVAEELGRRSVITEISPEYCRMARERIDKQQPSLSFLEDVR